MKKIIIASVSLVLIGVIFIGIKVDANALFFLPTVTSSAATSSPSYITTAGVNASATTTFDAYANGSPRAANYATVFSQFVASSTSSVFTVRIQYSQDGVDWYSDFINISTTTNPTNIATEKSYTFTAVSTATTSKAFKVETPTRYMRVVNNVSGAAGGVWTQIIPTREVIN